MIYCTIGGFAAFPPRQSGEMKKIALVYSSKSGHTKQYADWLKEDVGDIDVIPVATFSPSQTMAYKLIIFACGVYGDKLSIMDYVKKNITAMSPQKTMIMAVSWYTNDSEEAKKKLIEENYPEQFKNSVPIFVLNSGVDKKSLSAMDKMKLTAAQVMIDKKDGRSSDDINALAIIKGYSDQTSKDNLASIKKAIDEFFNPPKAAPTPSVQAKPAPAQAAHTAPAASPAPAAPAPEPKPAPTPVPKPMAVSEMKSDADALDSLENAFKALKAPKAPAPKPEPITESKPESKPEPAPAPQPKPKPKANIDPVKASVASSVKDAIAALSSGEMTTNYAPVPTFEIDDEETDTYSEAVADSIMLMNQTVTASKPVQSESKPAETPAPKPVQTAPKPAETPASQPVQTALKPAETPAPKPVQSEPKPAETPAPKPVQSEPKPAETAQQSQRKNSYMELFAKRRRNPESASAAAPASSAAPVTPAAPKAEEVHASPVSAPIINEAPAPRPTAATPKPTAQPAPKAASQPTPKPAAKPAARPAASAAKTVPTAPGKKSDAVIDFDFIMDDGPVPTVEIPKSEPAPAAPVPSIDIDVYDFISEDDKPAVSNRAMNAVQDLAKAKAEAEKEKLKAAVRTETNSDIIEKMKHDIETLAEESEHEIEVVSEKPAEPVAEEDEEGLEGFTFSNDIEYDLDAEFADPIDMAPEKTAQEKESKTNLDIRKLQEEINASIEQNKATKEKMEKRYGKKEKEEYHNPFAVQFEEDESKNKKKKKTVEVKRLADPIDPDIFFNKAGKDYDSTPGEMPEIKFRNR